MKKIIIFLLFQLILFSQVYAQLQSDQSDAVWSIVSPVCVALEIDMGQVLVNSNKDSVITAYLKNPGSYPCRIDSIYFRSADATSFEMVSGFPKLIVSAGGNHTCEFRFSPKRIGNHKAEIVIITQADTLVQNIIGEGFQPQIAIVNDIIDFGQVLFGSQKDTLQAITIKNVGTIPINITKIIHGKPNDVDFTTLAGSGALTLQTGETKLMDLQFKPSDVGRTSGVLEFHYDGVGSPALVQLFGEGLFAGIATAELKTNEISAYPGDEISIPIILNNQEYLALSGATSMKADLVYNSTLLWPINFTQEIIDETTAKITINNLPVNVVVGETLSTVHFKVGLGNTEECDLLLSNAESDNGLVDISLISGYFRLLGVCPEGGARLVNRNAQTGIVSLSPNPAESTLEIKIELTEIGYTDLSIYNIMGERVKGIFSENINPLYSSHSMNLRTNISELDSGQYFLIFRTPTFIATRRIIILK